MATYPQLARLMRDITATDPATAFDRQVIPYLISVWLEDYATSAATREIVVTSVSSFSYLFDTAEQRLLAAWGVSRGRYAGERDKSRMLGHPMGHGSNYHRGHAIPHRLGGATDINLVAQLGAVNVGAFRILEGQAVATPGTLYFTYWQYARHGGQKPKLVDQGLLIPGQAPIIRTHPN
jgi:hypothetical protein